MASLMDVKQRGRSGGANREGGEVRLLGVG
jgi:hypothetical protein